MNEMKTIKRKYCRVIKRLDKYVNKNISKEKFSIINDIYKRIKEILNNLPMICIFYGTLISEANFDNINDIDILILIERKYKPSLYKIMEIKKFIKEKIETPREIDVFFFSIEEMAILKKKSVLLKTLKKGIYLKLDHSFKFPFFNLGKY